MPNNISYPTADKIVEYNLLVLSMIKVKKADRAEVLNYHGIVNVINKCKEAQGDIYDKAVCLLKGLVQIHAFASGNRRTAFVAAKDFVNSNSGIFRIKDDPQHARVMQGIRENYYSDGEIKEWIKNGKIREFKR